MIIRYLIKFLFIFSLTSCGYSNLQKKSPGIKTPKKVLNNSQNTTEKTIFLSDEKAKLLDKLLESNKRGSYTLREMLLMLGIEFKQGDEATYNKRLRKIKAKGKNIDMIIVLIDALNVDYVKHTIESFKIKD
jgi:hypothetical protein